jgi:peptidoglycan hydrolase-like protein with peptidoglycan-binding domain
MNRTWLPAIERARGLAALLAVSLLVNLIVVVWLIRPRTEPSRDDLSVTEAASELRFEVERRILTEDSRLNVTLETTPGTSVAAPGEEPRVVTDVLVEAGTIVDAGHQLVRLNGRPIWTLPLPFPLYRDIEPGSSGDDVIELQRGLNALNPSPSLTVDGEYGPSTQDAIESLYATFGVEPDRVTAEQVGLAEVTAEVEQLEREVEGLAADADASDQDVASARHRLDTAREAQALAAAGMGIIVRRGDVVPMAEGTSVAEVSVAVGQTINGGDSLLVTGQSNLIGTAPLSEEQAEGLVVGQEAVPDDPDWAIGTVVDLVREADSSSLTARLDFGPAPTEPLAQSLGVTVSRTLTEEAVLALPVSVVFVDEAGRYIVRVPDEGSAWREIEIKTGVVGGGFIEIVDGPLEEGDVVLGG